MRRGPRLVVIQFAARRNPDRACVKGANSGRSVGTSAPAAISPRTTAGETLASSARPATLRARPSSATCQHPLAGLRQAGGLAVAFHIGDAAGFRLKRLRERSAMARIAPGGLRV